MTAPGRPAGVGEAKRLRYARQPVILTTDRKRFMCKSDHAVDVAFMMSCAEAFLFKHGLADRFELGELIVRYLDGDASTDDVRRELKEWSAELAEEDEDAVDPTPPSLGAEP